MSGEPEHSERVDPVALLAHDLRAATADVVGGLRLLEGEALTPDAHAQVERVRASTELLARLVEELLGERGGAGGAARGDAVADLARILEDELRRWRGAGAPQGVAVTLTREALLPALLAVEPLALRRIIANAMGNALRHARAAVELRAAPGEGGTVVIEVLDDGPGFPADVLDDPFRAARPGAGSVGTGLGLHIAADHAEWIGGRLEIRNRSGGGGAVALTLPAALALAPVSEAAPADLTGWRILVADDSATVQSLVAGMLGQLGATSERAGDGVAALNWLARERFDLALIDVEMPVLGGREVIRAERLRQARGVAPPTPLVALTGHASPAMREALLEDGAEGMLPKPLPEIDVFGRMLAGIVEAAGGRLDWQPDAAPPLSAATLASLMMAAGPDHVGEVLARLRGDLADTEAALDAALRASDRQGVRFQTHVLLSLAGAIGALPTQSVARRLNALAHDGPDEAVRITGRICLSRLGELRTELEGAVQNP
ncbi:hybrid sensor histidine kinase/response regulator [Jannaschia sp. W003]|uniref:hybrid sensor histidine kinase/response regulator n=1 Tax=Jannaschia sp. W003 TaxID=2867012 RepID=UPI0021A4EBB0|nr:hybrid sensor histidine kinase/response regulator [Jannaschia sp. W003]UWQ20177.1 hybrid sensor histidine kinase/response regulator [Jannaschia sp. W003]